MELPNYYNIILRFKPFSDFSQPESTGVDNMIKYAPGWHNELRPCLT